LCSCLCFCRDVCLMALLTLFYLFKGELVEFLPSVQNNFYSLRVDGKKIIKILRVVTHFIVTTNKIFNHPRNLVKSKILLRVKQNSYFFVFYFLLFMVCEITFLFLIPCYILYDFGSEIVFWWVLKIMASFGCSDCYLFAG